MEARTISSGGKVVDLFFERLRKVDELSSRFELVSTDLRTRSKPVLSLLSLDISPTKICVSNVANLFTFGECSTFDTYKASCPSPTLLRLKLHLRRRLKLNYL